MSQLKTLPKIADDLLAGLADDMALEEYDLLTGRLPAQQVAYAYVHGDCDVFAEAMHRALGWGVVSVSHSAVGLMHRMVADPEGRLLDAEGWQDVESIGKRYRKRRGLAFETIDQPGAFFGAEDEQIETAIEAALQLPWKPFKGPDLQERLQAALASLRAEMRGEPTAAAV